MGRRYCQRPQPGHMKKRRKEAWLSVRQGVSCFLLHFAENEKKFARFSGPRSDGVHPRTRQTRRSRDLVNGSPEAIRTGEERHGTMGPDWARRRRAGRDGWLRTPGGAAEPGP